MIFLELFFLTTLALAFLGALDFRVKRTPPVLLFSILQTRRLSEKEKEVWSQKIEF